MSRPCLLFRRRYEGISYETKNVVYTARMRIGRWLLTQLRFGASVRLDAHFFTLLYRIGEISVKF